MLSNHYARPGVAPRFAMVALMLSSLASGCNDAAGDEVEEGTVNGVIAGTVFKGLLEGGRVSVYAESEGRFDEVVAETETDAAGAFEVDVGRARGDLLLEVTGGSYVEEATGEEAPLGSRRLRAWALDFEVGERRTEVQINPVTTLIVAYVNWRMESLEEDRHLAERRAARLIEEHFAEAGWRSVTPVNPTTRRDLPFEDDAVMGVLISGLSRRAKDMAIQSGATGATANASALIELLAEDLEADGKFDGLGRSGRSLAYQGQALDGQTLRVDLALSTIRFLESERNLSDLSREEMQAILYAIAGRDSELFASPPDEPFLEPPEISLGHPQAGSAVRQVVELTATAVDPVAVTDLRFKQPPELRSAEPEDLGQTQAVVRSTLDTSPFPDGPLTIVVVAENERGLRSLESFELIIANESPLVTIEKPSPGPVKGEVEIVAHAEPSPEREARISGMLALRPEGLENVSGSPCRFEASWNTELESEGYFNIKIVALDDHGSEGMASVTVEVANLEPVRIEGVALIAGRPVSDASVTAIALDPPDGKTDSSILGTARTDETGAFALTINDRSYSGPLEIRVAEGGSWTSPIGERALSTSASRRLATYLPSPDHLHEGDHQKLPLVVGVWSTLAASLARYYSTVPEQPYEPAEAWARAVEMLAGHFRRPPNHRCLHSSSIFDLTEEEEVGFEDALFSLGDMGLAWMMRDVQDVSLLDLTAALSSDIATGRFDGHDGDQSLPTIGEVEIDIDTTRIALAVAIHDFVASFNNVSGISIEDLMEVSAGGMSFLDTLATDSREIYGEPGTAFDQSGPLITWLRPEANSTASDETVIVEAEASDSTGIHSFFFLEPLIDGVPLSDEAGAVGRVMGLVPNTVPPNAPDHMVRVTVGATDQLGNASSGHLYFTRRPPSARIDEIEVRDGTGWAKASGPVGGEVRVHASGTAGFATSHFGLVSPDPSLASVGEDLDDGEQSLLVEIDTTNDIPDGPFSVEVCHETIEARLACDEAELLVDNTPPDVTVAAKPGDGSQAGWFGCEDPWLDCDEARVIVEYTAFDATSGVSELVLQGSGHAEGQGFVSIPPKVKSLGSGACVLLPCEGTLEVSLPAGGYALHLEARDGAGNSVQTETIGVMVDTSSPLISDCSGTFDDEGLMDFVRDGSSFVYEPRDAHEPFSVPDALDGPAGWRKMEHRLAAATLTEAEAANIPVIKVAAWNPGEEAGESDLNVEYLHGWALKDGSYVDSPAGWRPLLEITDQQNGPSGEVATHALPVSFDMLGPELATQREQRLRIRATNRAGNMSEKVYAFYLGLLPAPVAMEVDTGYAAAADPESIYAYDFASANLHELFGGRSFEDGRVRVAKVTVHQPHEDLAVRVEAKLSGEVTLTREQRQVVLPGKVYEHECWEPPSIVVMTLQFEPFGWCYGERDPDPENDDPPCLDSWGHPDRAYLYKREGDGHQQCVDARVLPPEGPSEESSATSTPSDLILLDTDGQRVLHDGDGVFMLEEGTYTGYIRVPAPGGFMPERYTGDHGTVYGELVQSRRVHDGDLEPFWVEKHEYNGPCVPDYTCLGHRTRDEDAVRYERVVSWQGSPTENGEHFVSMLLRTASATHSFVPWRDPYTAGENVESAPELYPVDHTDIEGDP